jgi:ATP-dependent DNA helicase DinG
VGEEILQLVLGRQSPLAAFVPSFQPRQEQMILALAASQALEQSATLVAQIGTGSGKTLGYLVPALLSGLKIIVSTGTKTLQEQISQKELPLLQKALSPDLRWAVLKGRANYLCLRRAKVWLGQPELPFNWGRARKKLLHFQKPTSDGDLDQIREFLPEGLWEEITSSSEQCQGSHCPERENCFLLQARHKAGLADVVVVNHHLFMADLVLKGQGHGQLLPRWQAAIFDEAHLLPEIATQAFGVQVSLRRVISVLRAVGKETNRPSLLAEALSAAAQAGEQMFGALSQMLAGRGSLGLNAKHWQILKPCLERLQQSLENLKLLLEDGEEEESLEARVEGLILDLQTLPNPIPGHSLTWAQVRGGAPALILSPIEVGPHLQEHLYSQEAGLIFTSATLAPLDDLNPFRRRMGLDPENNILDLSLPSPFDLAKQALLYVPRDTPEPAHPGFSSALLEQLLSLLGLSQGRAFVLFTTQRNLDQTAAALRGRLPFHMLVQGQAPKLTLLKQFIEQSPAILLATASFWQGVDIPGPSLSAVIVDKLPFAPPDDPLVAARCQLAEEAGNSGFAHVLLPEAILSLKQGLGRLIRSPEDRGIMAVLDSRIWKKSYGQRFLKALQPLPVTDRLEKVKDFFQI